MNAPIRHRTIALLLALTAGLSACLAGCRQEAAQAPASPSAAPAQAPSKPVQTTLGLAELEKIVNEVMEHEYPGAHDLKHGCWTYAIETDEDELAYCMRPHPAHEVTSESGTMVYFYASNATDIRGNPDYAYAAVDSGVMAAFEVSISPDKRWTLVASEKGMEFGTNGACNCDDARFVRLGKAYYGWTFTSGGMWQGVIVSNQEIVAPHEHGFKDISDIPSIREGAQNVEYRTEVLADDPGREFYPLRVEKYQADHKVGERIVEFDRGKWMYAGIGDF